jgi:hypothetical protein
MPQNDAAVLNAAVGYVYTGTVGTAPPTPAALKTLDLNTYGAQVQTLKITGNPTGGTFTLTVGGQTTAAIPYNATTAQVQAALALLTSVGSGNVLVTGTLISDASGFDISWIGTRFGTSQTLTSTPTLTGGTTPAAPVTLKTSGSGWKPVGHTSRGTLPEFGFDGDTTEIRGSWQKKKLREIQTEDPIDYLTVVLHQMDKDSLALYYGANASVTSGVFGVSSFSQSQNIETAGLVVIVDGTQRLGFHFHKAAVKRDDAIELPIDDLAALPIKFTFLDHNNELLFSWINEDLFA